MTIDMSGTDIRPGLTYEEEFSIQSRETMAILQNIYDRLESKDYHSISELRAFNNDLNACPQVQSSEHQTLWRKAQVTFERHVARLDAYGIAEVFKDGGML